MNNVQDNCVKIYRANSSVMKQDRQGAGSLVAKAWAIADDVLLFHDLVFSPDKTNQLSR